ncbi:MAG TPA: type II CAAX endopeptidase family protein [Crinalium sp.]
MLEHSLPTVKPKPWGVWATLGFSLVIFGVFLLIQTLVLLAFLAARVAQEPSIDPQVLQGSLAFNGLVLAIATLASAPVCIALIALFAKLRKQLSLHDYLGLHRPTRRQVLEWCSVAVMCNVGIDLLKSFVDLPIIPPVIVKSYETAFILPLFYLAVVVMAPVFEELFFRGFLYQGFRHSFLKVTGAIAIPSLLWALIHQQYDWIDVAGIFIFGIVLGLARHRTGSVYVAVSMHALNNFLALMQVAWTVHSS